MSFARRVVSGTAQLALSNGIVRLLSIFSMPIVTSLLNPHAYGIGALVATTISLGAVFALAGIDVSYSRAYHAGTGSSMLDVERCCWRFAIANAFAVGLICGTAWLVVGTQFPAIDGLLAVVITLGIVFAVMNTMAQTRSRLSNQYRQIAFSNVFAGVIALTTTVTIASWWRQDALALVIPILLGYLLPVLCLGTPSTTLLFRSAGLPRKEALTIIKVGLAAVVTAPMYWVLCFSDRWFLQAYWGTEAVGVYAVGYSVAVAGMLVNAAITSVWLPEAAREYETDRSTAPVTLGRLSLRLIALQALVWLWVATAGGDIIRLLTHPRFHASAEYIPYLAGGVFFYGVSQLALSSLVVVRQLRAAAIWWAVGGLVCLSLNATLIARYGAVGAAMAQVGSFGLVCLGLVWSAQRRYPIDIPRMRVVWVLGIVFLTGAVLSRPWHDLARVSVLMKLPAATGVSMYISWLVAPDWCIRLTASIRGRLAPA